MNRFWIIFLIVVCVRASVFQVSASHSQEKPLKTDLAAKPPQPQTLSIVTDSDDFYSIIQESGPTLVLFDFYADWCLPCKMLEPILANLAQEFQSRMLAYRINVETHRKLAAEVGVRSLPYVVFFKDGKPVQSFMGLHPKDAYRRIIEGFTESIDRTFQADGIVVGGKRIVKRSTAAPLDSIYVYRGDTVKLVIEDVSFPYSVHIPEFNVSQEAAVGRPLEVTFTARELGVFPVYCNGDCPTGDGQQFGQIVVMQLEGDDRTLFREISAKEAEQLIHSTSPLILDVRTPKEFYQSHIPGAVLLPVQQLQDRVRELEAYKEKDVLIYCRSGNRSTVAANILMGAGFKRLHNLRHGIIEWERENLTLIQ